jgi:O-acetyl-ADP-ribose deacetylase (regulator of RNase III)
MIRYVTGNLLEASVEALVNTVNTVGVMGKGVALQFKETFPQNFAEYEAACRRGEVRIGRMFVTKTGRLTGPRLIINFPTKVEWRHPSKMEYIRSGLSDLIKVVRDREIRSIALPPLGCGNGGLDWQLVRGAIEDALAELQDVDIVVFEPTAKYQTAPKRAGVEELTIPRAMVVDLIQRYAVLGFECTNLEVQKLVYLVQRVMSGMGLNDEFALKFTTNKYGPYADALRHLLDSLDGSYLHCEKRLADAGPFDAITIDSERLPRVREFLGRNERREFTDAIRRVDQIIDGFQSPYLMELLATVDWVSRPEGPGMTDQVSTAVSRWPGGASSAERKSRLFKPEQIELAVNRLRTHADVLYPRVEAST